MSSNEILSEEEENSASSDIHSKISIPKINKIHKLHKLPMTNSKTKTYYKLIIHTS